MILSSANDGVHIILGMLVVAFIFLGVIGLGEFVRAATHRRHARRARPS